MIAKANVEALRAFLNHGARFALLTGRAEQLLRLVPDEAIHHVISDPPFSARLYDGGGVRANPTKGKRPPVVDRLKSPKLSKFNFEYCALTDQAVRQTAHELGRFFRWTARWALIFTDAEDGVHDWICALELGAGTQHTRVGHWLKTNAQPQFSGDRPAVGTEAIVIQHSAEHARRWNGGGKAAVWPFAVSRDKETAWHPTPKPIELCVQLILDFTEPGETILDPWAGSASMGLAALRTGRRYLGIELRPDWAKKARAMLKREAEHPPSASLDPKRIAAADPRQSDLLVPF